MIDGFFRKWIDLDSPFQTVVSLPGPLSLNPKPHPPIPAAFFIKHVPGRFHVFFFHRPGSRSFPKIWGKTKLKSWIDSKDQIGPEPLSLTLSFSTFIDGISWTADRKRARTSEKTNRNIFCFLLK